MKYNEPKKTQRMRTAMHLWMKRASVSICIACIVVVFFGCSQRDDTSVKPTYQGKASDSAGLSDPQIDSGIPDDSIVCHVVDDTLIVTHQDAYYQCCLEARMVVHKNENTLDIVEYDMGQPCDCMCTFDLTTRIVDLPPGEYTLQVWSEFGQFYGTCTVTIPEGARLADYAQTECLAYPKTSTIESLQDSIGVVYQDDTLFVTHFDAYYNCCFRIEVEFQQKGTDLHFIEHPTGDPCRCMCFFNIVSKITDLTPNTYVIRVWNEDQTILFGEAIVTIPPDRVAKTGVVPDEPPSPRPRWWYHFDQDGCKENPKKYQSTTMNSYRMRLNVYGFDKPERRYGRSKFSNRVVECV